MEEFIIDVEGVSISKWAATRGVPHQIKLSESAVEKIRANRAFLQEKMEIGKAPVYGINTGFGSLCNEVIPGDKLEELQYNLIRSHAAGAGDRVPDELVRWMMMLKIQNFAYGYSGVRLELVEQLIALYNKQIVPVVYQQGSLGASGDLAPLAHLSLPLIGEGEVRVKGVEMPAKKALRKTGLKPIDLRAKEGLALLNGTQFSTAYGLWSVVEGRKLAQAANFCAALSMDVFNVQVSPLHPMVHRIRQQKGQILAAREISEWLEGGDLSRRPGKEVQDPYAFRCVPQVHGASIQALNHVRQTIQNEMNAVTDNPNVIEEEDAILSAGNFHAQPIALVLDYLAIALSEFASISERRTYQLISGQRGLPAYLIESAGLHSGLMIAQYTAASVVSQNKQYCTPASVDSIVSSLGQEDHVSMAANAATKLVKVVDNVWTVLGIELLTGFQANYLRSGETAPAVKEVLEELSAHIHPITEDRVLQKDMKAAADFLRNRKW